MWLIALLVAGFAILLNRSLKERIDQLEKQVQILSSQRATLPPAHTAPITPENPIPPVPGVPPTIASVQRPQVAAPATVSGEDVFFNWMKENWLLALGALLLLIGFGWLVSYAFLHNWIGPAGRIGLGMLGGTLILSIGFWRIRTVPTQGGVFIVLGATVLLLTVYAARSIYHFFTPETALVFMFAVSALVALAAGIYNRKPLAVISVLMAGGAPMMVASPSHDFVSLFTYVLVVVLGSIWLAVWKGYREVVLAALVVVFYYSLPPLFNSGTPDRDVLLLFAYGFAAIFYVTHTIGLIRLSGNAATSDVLVALGNSLFLAVWVYFGAQKEWQSLILMAWAVVFVLGAFVVFRKTGTRETMYMYTGVAVAYIVAATALELSGSALTLAYLFEAAVFSLSMYAVTKDIAVAHRSTLALILPAALSLQSITSSAWRTEVFSQDFFVLAAHVSVFFILGGMYFEKAQRSTTEIKQWNAWLMIIGTIYAYVLLWLSLHAAMPQTPDTAVMIALFVYTIIGIVTYVIGSRDGSSGLRAYGGTILALVVARLLIVDVWQMALTGRIITFFLIGALLMSTAFISMRKKAVHEDIKA